MTRKPEIHQTNLDISKCAFNFIGKTTVKKINIEFVLFLNATRVYLLMNNRQVLFVQHT